MNRVTMRHCRMSELDAVSSQAIRFPPEARHPVLNNQAVDYCARVHVYALLAFEMCDFSEAQSSYSFRWITYLVLITGIYTFVHWFLVTPLTYSHLHECCNETWPKDWVVWLLAASFITWFIVVLFILFLWLCARTCCGENLHESNVFLTETKTSDKNYTKEDRGISSPLREGPESPTKSDADYSKGETVLLSDMGPQKDNFTVVGVNEVGCPEEPIPPPMDFTIPVEETRHFVQPNAPGKEKASKKNDLPLKSPREIFFKDLIEAAEANPTNLRNSYFDFDPNKFSLTQKNCPNFKKKMEEVEENEESGNTEKTFFIGSREGSSNVTSELYVTLDERGVVEEQAAVGEFRILN